MEILSKIRDNLADSVTSLNPFFSEIGLDNIFSTNIKDKLEQGHLIRNFICEHEIILEYLSEFNDNISKIKYIYNYNDSRDIIKDLINNLNNLIGAKNHNIKEEKVLFPELSDKNISEILDIVKSEHEKIDIYGNKIKELLLLIDAENYLEYRTEIINMGELYSGHIKNEIDLENNIVYPIALKLIDRDEIWEKMKYKCSDIGLCSFILPF